MLWGALSFLVFCRFPQRRSEHTLTCTKQNHGMYSSVATGALGKWKCLWKASWHVATALMKDSKPIFEPKTLPVRGLGAHLFALEISLMYFWFRALTLSTSASFP